MEKLKKSEVVCDHCDGHGSYRIRMRTHICSKCLGEGKLDWISAIMGRAKPKQSDVYPSLGIDPNVGVDLYYDGTKVFKTSERGIE
jgi:RecJ-like exonuclease